MKLLRRGIIEAESDENAQTKSARYVSENPMDQIEKAFISELEAEKSRAAEPQTEDNRQNESFNDVEIIVVDSPRSSAKSRQASGTRQPDNTKKHGEEVSEVRYSNEWHVESQMLEDLSDAKNMKDF